MISGRCGQCWANIRLFLGSDGRDHRFSFSQTILVFKGFFFLPHGIPLLDVDLHDVEEDDGGEREKVARGADPVNKDGEGPPEEADHVGDGESAAGGHTRTG